MSILTTEERRIAEALAGIGYCNPFLPERMVLERIALGSDCESDRVALSHQPGASFNEMFPNQQRLCSLAKHLTDKFRDGIIREAAINERDRLLYEDLALYHLYTEYISPLDQLTYQSELTAESPFPLWEQFQQDFNHYLQLPEVTLPDAFEPEHVLACFYQIERAFHLIFDF